MADLTLSVLVGAGAVQMENRPPNGAIVSPNVYSKVTMLSFGDTVWTRNEVKNDFMDGAILVSAAKDNPHFICGVRLYAANISDIWTYCNATLIPAWEAFDFNVAVTINGAASTFECQPADHKLGGSGSKGDLDANQFRAAMQELVFTAPRSPVAVSGPNF